MRKIRLLIKMINVGMVLLLPVVWIGESLLRGIPLGELYIIENPLFSERMTTFFNLGIPLPMAIVILNSLLFFIHLVTQFMGKKKLQKQSYLKKFILQAGVLVVLFFLTLRLIGLNIHYTDWGWTIQQVFGDIDSWLVYGGIVIFGLIDFKLEISLDDK